MATTPAWRDYAKRVLKAELKARRITYYELSDRLYRIGLLEFEWSIRNKISRGSFSAAFFLQCLVAIGVTSLKLNDSHPLMPRGSRQNTD